MKNPFTEMHKVLMTKVCKYLNDLSSKVSLKAYFNYAVNIFAKNLHHSFWYRPK